MPNSVSSAAHRFGPLFTVCNWLPGDEVDLTPFPKIRAFMAQMQARPSVQKAIADGMLPNLG